jgi:hydroxyethylthiazole kinase-like uncharacterized protein yjeF
MYDTVFHTILNRPDDAHKYQCGHLLVIGGSPGMVGAPLLAAEAAMRIGAGLVTIGSTGPVIDKLESRVKEIMTVSLSEDPAAALQAVVTFVRERSVSAIVIGPGSKADRLVTELLANITVPLVIDGGGLAALHGHLELLKGSTTAKSSIILTPHRGEFQKLLDSTLPDSAEEMHTLAQQFAVDTKTHLVLKGNHTMVAHPDNTSYINSTGNPGLATAGTGDVLAGVIGGLLAQGIDPSTAAEAGVYIHGLAGDLAAVEFTQAGLIASDVIDFLSKALTTYG